MRNPRTSLAAALVVAALASLGAVRPLPAHAEEGAQPPAAAAARPNPVGISEEGRSHFAAGVTLLQDPEGERVEEAYREFKTAFDLSGSPKILGNMGFCAMRLERDGEAIDAYTRYLREVPDIEADERAQIVRDLQTLTVGVARLTLTVDKPGARVTDVRVPVRGERVTNAYGPVMGTLELGVRPGHHIFTVRLNDHEDATWEVEVFAASRDRNAFVMRPRVVALAPSPAGDGGGKSAGPWVVLGVGGAMLLGGAVTGIIALGKTSEIEGKCPSNACPIAYDLSGDRAAARTFVRITDLLFLGGGLVTGGGLALLLSRSGEGGPPQAPPAPAHSRAFSFPSPTAGCGPDGCRASMKVVF